MDLELEYQLKHCLLTVQSHLRCDYTVNPAASRRRQAADWDRAKARSLVGGVRLPQPIVCLPTDKPSLSIAKSVKPNLSIVALPAPLPILETIEIDWPPVKISLPDIIKLSGWIDYKGVGE